MGVVGVEDDPSLFEMPKLLRRVRGELLDEFFELSVRTISSLSFRDLARRCLCDRPSDSSGISGMFNSSPRALESHLPGGTEERMNIVRRRSSIRYGMAGPTACGVWGDVMVGGLGAGVTTVIGIEDRSIINDEG